MEMEDLKPRQGHGTYRIGDSDDLVLIENATRISFDRICLQDHGVIILCLAGKIRFEYDGTEIQLQKDDMFLYMVNSVVSNFNDITRFQLQADMVYAKWISQCQHLYCNKSGRYDATQASSRDTFQ